MTERVPAIKVLLLPKDTNALGTIFGGVILSHIDLASAVEARKSGAPPLRHQGDARGGVPRAGVRRRHRQLLHRDPARRPDVGHRRRHGRSRALGRRRTASASRSPRPRSCWWPSAPTASRFRSSRRPRPADDRRLCARHRVERGCRLRRARASRSTSRATSWPRRWSTSAGVAIADIQGDGGRLPRDAGAEHRRRRRATPCWRRSARRAGVALMIHKGLPLASGVGSSGASAVAAVVAVNELLGRPAHARPAAALRDGGRAGRLRRRPSRQRRAGALRRLRAGAQRRSARHRAAAGARRAGVRRAASAHGGADRRGARAARRHRAADRRRCASGPTSARWSSALHTGDLALLSRPLEDHVAEPKRAGAGARASAPSRRRRSRPAPSGAACRAPARRSSRSPRRSTRRRRAGAAMAAALGDGVAGGRRRSLGLAGRHARARASISRGRGDADVREHARSAPPAVPLARRCGAGSRPTAGSTCRHAVPVDDRRTSGRRCAAGRCPRWPRRCIAPLVGRHVRRAPTSAG